MALGPFYVAEKLKGGNGMRGVALLMRHGETAWNREGRVMGRNPIELDADGRAQVQAAIPFARADQARTDRHESARACAAIGGNYRGRHRRHRGSRRSATLRSAVRALGRDGLRRSDRGSRLHALSRASAGRADARRRDDPAGAVARGRGGRAARSRTTAAGASCSSRTATSSAPCCAISCGSNSRTSAASASTTRRSRVSS